MTQNINDVHTDSLTWTEKVAQFITDKVGTFSCFVFFTFLACFSLPATIQAHSAILWVQWITQTFLQLVLLPLIMIGQNLQSRHSELRANEDYEVNVKAEKEIEEIHRKLDILLGGEIQSHE
jgi:uncharacterized membrane protein